MSESWKPIRQIDYNNCRCNVVRGFYNNNRHSLQLYNAQDGTPVATATTNISDYPVSDDKVIIKNAVENHGLKEILIDKGFIGPEIGTIKSGNTYATLHKLLYL